MNVEFNLSLKFSHGHLRNKRNKVFLQNLHVFVMPTRPSHLLMRPMRASSNPVLFTRMTSAPEVFKKLGHEKLFQHLSLFGLHRAWIGLYRYDMYVEYTRYPCFICFDKSLLFFVTSSKHLDSDGSSAQVSWHIAKTVILKSS